MKRRGFILGVASGAVVSSCGPSYRRATQEEVTAAYYRHGGAPSIALLSMVNDWGNKSEHAGLLINGDQRVLYDPAGTYDPAKVEGWYVPPRKNDIHYGMTDRAVRQYQYFHARRGYFVHQQTVPVSIDVANKAIKLCEARGETMFTQCASSASWVLRQLHGFENVRQTMFPESIRNDFANIPTVEEKFIRDNDEGQNYKTAQNLHVGDPNDIAPPLKPEFGRGEG